MALWSVMILELRIKLEHLVTQCWWRTLDKYVTNVRHQHRDKWKINVNLEQVVRLFWHLWSQWPHGRSTKNYEDHKRPIFPRHFQETIYKADRIFPSLNLKILSKSTIFLILAHFSSKSKIFHGHLMIGMHFCLHVHQVYF